MAGFGTEIGKLIPEWAVRQDRKNCKCKSRKAFWDSKPKKWIERNKIGIESQLVSQRRYLKAPLNKMPPAACRMALRPLIHIAISRTTT